MANQNKEISDQLYSQIDNLEERINKIESNQPYNFEDKYKYHLSLFDIYCELAFLYEIKEFTILQIRKIFINFIFCLLLARDNKWKEKKNSILEKGKNFFEKIQNNAKFFILFKEEMKSEEFEKQLAFIYSDPIDSNINKKFDHSFKSFKNNCIEIIMNLNKGDLLIEYIDLLPFIFRIEF